MAGSEQRARHRRLEFVGHPACRVGIKLGGRIEEAARTAAPIDEPLNEANGKQSDGGDVQRVCLAAPDRRGGGGRRAAKGEGGHKSLPCWGDGAQCYGA